MNAHHRLPLRPLFFLLALLQLAVLVPFALAAPAGREMRVVYGFDREFPPFSYEDAGGEPIGFEVEVVRAIFNGTGVNLFTRPLNWDMVPVELSGGTITLTTGMVRTEQRERLYLFSEQPTFPLQIRLFTKTYNRYPSAAQLRGQPVAVGQGTFEHRLLDMFAGMNMKFKKDRLTALRALYNDEVSAYCGPVQTAYYYINKLNYGGITTVGTPLGITEMRIAVNRDRGDILRLVNQGLARIMQNGEYDRLYRKWFVRELSSEEEQALLGAATRAALPAYAPYEEQAAGAAILTATGRIFTGCTVENADPALSLSALRSAVSRAVAEGEFEFRAAVCVTQDGRVVAPTSEDLQTLYEFGRGVLALLSPQPDRLVTRMVAELLPVPVSRPAAGIIFE